MPVDAEHLPHDRHVGRSVFHTKLLNSAMISIAHAGADFLSKTSSLKSKRRKEETEETQKKTDGEFFPLYIDPVPSEKL